jgi:alcohol dehydrogenase
MEHFFYKLPVPVDFGAGKRHKLPQLLKDMHLDRGLLISAPSMVRKGLAQELKEASDGRIVAIFSDIQPNPTVVNTEACAERMRKERCSFAVALGGGSVMDCAKAACFAARTPYRIADYLSGKRSVTAPGIPLIAMPTTSGTASEVTGASVITDTERKVKALITSEYFYPVYALIDPELTYSCPPAVTAASGLDVLAHSLEAWYGKRHQPLTDLAAQRAASLVFQFLLRAYHQPDDAKAREQMSLASVTAGLAFGLTSTAAAHACSYPLTQDYGLPHGEACAFTLPAFWRLNSRRGPESGRLQALSRRLGFKDSDDLADRIDQMKKEMGMRTTLEEVGIRSDEQLDRLVAKSFAPNMDNNPIKITRESLKTLYQDLYEDSRTSV